MRRVVLALLSLAFLGISAGAEIHTLIELDKEVYLDKCKGAWAGQMIGVCYGFPYEFRSNGKPITKDLRPWKPEYIKGAITQDDCYVEMTFLKALEDHGIYITHEQAGEAFAASEYPLWHANYHGRENVRRGIMPPLSGHPNFNRHADDIDFQIEADLFGIICPMMPKEAVRMCEVFGSIMNYGDGVYGGMFVAGMYAEAYAAGPDNVRRVIDAGLQCIPRDSQYAACIRDVIQWHSEHPEDWIATWKRIEEKWQDDIDCAPGNPFNIDAKINGAYIVMGLLYGDGDMARTVEVSTRCGQDADCNPSNAAGILGCMKGYKAIGAEWTGGIAAMDQEKFSYTDYSFETLIPACQRVTEAIIRATGGKIDGDSYTIIHRGTRAAPATLEQWVEQKDILAQPISRSDMMTWNPDWRVGACGHDMNPGLHSEALGRDGVLLLHPVSEEVPARIVARFDIPGEGRPELKIEVASHPRGDFNLQVWVNAQPLVDEIIDTKGKWKTVTVDLMPFTGKQVDVRIENHANDWAWEGCYLDEAVVSW